METLKFNNQPKAEVEKIPQENEGLLNGQEQESGKRENIILEIDGQKIEAVKYYFEYPERIQKETGILGYERIKIILDVDFSKEKQHKILLKLSEGEYPNYTANHTLGAYVSREQSYKDFRKERWFLQKIYGMSTIENKRQNPEYNGTNTIFNTTAGGPEADYIRTGYTLFEKETGKVLKEFDFMGNLPLDKEKISNGKCYAATILNESGLNLYTGGFFHTLSPKENLVSFGFPIVEADSFFSKYIKEVLDVYLNIDENNIKNNKLFGRTFESVKELFITNEYVKDFGLPKKLYTEELKMARKAILERIFREGRHLDDSGASLVYGGSRQAVQNGKMDGGEPHIPIFIGHDKIPQLSWGHAKYAHYFNDKSFNFFKFKHADHLPVKEEVASSDS